MNQTETQLRAALEKLLEVVRDARGNEDVDAMTTAGSYLCGDVMSEAVEAAELALAL